MSTFTITDFLDGIKRAEETKIKEEQEEALLDATIKQSLKKETPFAYINSINNKVLMEQTDDYAPFMVNQLFSMHPDTILNASLMNRIGQHLSNQMQYDYYMNTVRRGRRQWWYKTKSEKQNEDIAIVGELYKVNEERAHELYDMLTEVNPDELQLMVEQYKNRLGGR